MDSGSGVVLLDKPAGISSFKALGTIKTSLNTKKVGHTGTLDQFASGLLVTVVGSYTKLAADIEARDKEYHAVISFGTETDTLDPEGRIIREDSVPDIRRIEDAVHSFIGEVDQVPPIYSALKINGKRAYKLAREGSVPEMKSRPVTIYSIEIESDNLPEVTLLIRCSKGTYIRSLARDIGYASGSCAYVTALRRTKIGAFSVDKAVPSDNPVDPSKLIQGRDFFSILGMPVIEITEERIIDFKDGKPLTEHMFIRKIPSGKSAVFHKDYFLGCIVENGNRVKYSFVDRSACENSILV